MNKTQNEIAEAKQKAAEAKQEVERLKYHRNKKMKYPTGKECKKTDCARHESYVKWQCGDDNLSVCMKCKWAYPSQFVNKSAPVKI